MDFLWHAVSEKEKEEIKKQAKAIIDNFSKKLVDVDKMPEPLIERAEGEREEEGKSKSNFSREIMFENAPNKNKDFIVAEKKEW